MMNETNQPVLVTGGAGFIGSHLANRLVEHYNKDVYVLDDLSGGRSENLVDDVHFVQGSIENQRLVAKLFRDHDFATVYHLAAYAAEGLSHFIRTFNYRNNIIGTANILNQCVISGTRRIVFTSSIAVYGNHQPPMLESMSPNPEDPYGIAKYAVELDLAAAQRMFGLDFVIFRPHNVYGEHQNIGDRYRNVVGIFMNQIMKEEPFTIFGDGEQRRAFSYVKDIIDVLAESGWRDEFANEVFNLGADSVFTINQLADVVIKAFGKTDHPVVHLQERNEVKVAFSDHRKLQQITGDIDVTPLEEGIHRMAKWARARGPQSCGAFHGIEVTKNLPDSWLEK